MGRLTLDDIERRAVARGWLARKGEGSLTIYIPNEGIRSWWTQDTHGVMLQFSRHEPRDEEYLLGVTEAREGAARVLSVVSQVAALKQGQRLAWVAGAGERVRDVMDAVRVEP